MSKFFINRPIVAIVIAILTVIIGSVALVSLPIAQFPKIVPPEARITTTYVGADAQTVEQSVATPIEQVLSGVDNMNYMYSINGSDGSLRMTANFDVATDPNTDLILTQMRVTQAGPQIPSDVASYGVTVQKQLTAPLMLVALYSPTDSYDSTFLANYAYINVLDQLTRVPGIASATVFGAGQYAMRYWVKPDQLAKLNVTVGDVIKAVQSPEHGEPGGYDRRGARAQGPGLHLLGPRAGAPHDPRGVRRDRDPRQPGRLGGAPEGRGPGRARRAGLQRHGPLQR